MAGWHGYSTSMPRTDVDQVSERPLDDLVSTVSGQAVVLAREQMEMVRREVTAKARQAGPGVAMVGGAGVLAALASGTGTAGLVLLMARRPGSAAALGVAGTYAGASALLAREGLARLREVGPLMPAETVPHAKQNLGSAKQGAKSARKPARRSSAQDRLSTGSKRGQSTAKRARSTAAKRAPRAQARKPKRSGG
jgi:hypothetical protein